MDKKHQVENIDILKKFGDYYTASERTFIMGIDKKFTSHFAERFKNFVVLETCTGGGFTTISLARTAKHVITFEIDRSIQEDAAQNIKKADLSDRVTLINGNILNQNLIENLPPINSAFLDPDWAVTGPDHIYRFTNSNTNPPADVLLNKIFIITNNVALVLPPFIDIKELEGLPEHELEQLYMGDSLELYCLYFGKLIKTIGKTTFRI